MKIKTMSLIMLSMTSINLPASQLDINKESLNFEEEIQGYCGLHIKDSTGSIAFNDEKIDALEDSNAVFTYNNLENNDTSSLIITDITVSENLDEKKVKIFLGSSDTPIKVGKPIKMEGNENYNIGQFFAKYDGRKSEVTKGQAKIRATIEFVCAE